MVPVFSKAAWRCVWLMIQVRCLMNQEVFLNNQISVRGDNHIELFQIR